MQRFCLPLLVVLLLLGATSLALASDRVLAHTGGAEPRKVIARLPNVVSLVV